MAKATFQRLDYLEECRTKLRDLYLNVICRVKNIPMIRFDKSSGEGKVLVDAICQTEGLDAQAEAADPVDTLGQDVVVDKLGKLNDALRRVSAYLSQNVPHFNVVNFTLKDLRQKSDLVMFNQNEIFAAPPSAARKTANVAQDVKNDIRNIKGMFMSGQA